MRLLDSSASEPIIHLWLDERSMNQKNFWIFLDKIFFYLWETHWGLINKYLFLKAAVILFFDDLVVVEYGKGNNYICNSKWNVIFMIIKNFFQWLDFSSNDYIWIDDRGEAQYPRSSLSSHVNLILPSINEKLLLEVSQLLVICPCTALLVLLLLF